MTVPTLTAHRSGTDLPGAPLLVLGPSLGTAVTPLWDAAIDMLGERFAILAWDLPGHGSSPAATKPFTLGALAQAVLRVVNENGTEPFHYAGVSLGGAVGVELALRHPHRISSLTTLCSVPKFGEPQSWQERAAVVRTQSTAALVGASAGRWFAPGFMERNPRTASALLHSLSDADDESYALCCEVLADYDARGELAGISTGFLAISGEFDEVATPRAVGDFASAVPSGRSIELADAAHLAPAEQPERVAEALTEFILAHDPTMEGDNQ